MSRRTHLDELLSEKPPPGERLANFERWLFAQLERRLQWPADPAARTRQICQCRALVMQAVVDLSKRGFLFRPRPLARLLEEKIDQIAAAQRAGRATNLYPYFRAAWQNWVGMRAEELKAESMALGTYISVLERGVVTIPQLAERAREESSLIEARKAARQRARKAMAGTQLDFFNPGQ